MPDNPQTQKNAPNADPSTGTTKKKDTGEIREGQEDSSILYDKDDPTKELGGSLNRDISSTSQEEYIDNDQNTTKEKE